MSVKRLVRPSRTTLRLTRTVPSDAKRRLNQGPAVWSPRSGYVCMLESDAGHLSEVETVRMSRGDVLLVGPRTPHRSLLNRSNRTRWSVDLRYTPRP